MRKKNNGLPFGENVEGYTVPVLNEREIRAAAGIMFLVLSTAFVLIVFRQDFRLVKYVILVFLTDFIIRVFVSPRFSPLLVIGRLVVSNQVPEYVGAPQKRFAWKIGIFLSGLMFILLVVLNNYSALTFVSCLFCLVFLFFESAFGICLGCWVYRLFYKKEVTLCVGEICKGAEKQAIQKISGRQLLVMVGFVIYVLLTMVFFGERISATPKSLKEIIRSEIASNTGQIGNIDATYVALAISTRFLKE